VSLRRPVHGPTVSHTRDLGKQALVDRYLSRRDYKAGQGRSASGVGVGSRNLKRKVLFAGEAIAVIRNSYRVFKVP